MGTGANELIWKWGAMQTTPIIRGGTTKSEVLTELAKSHLHPTNLGGRGRRSFSQGEKGGKRMTQG